MKVGDYQIIWATIYSIHSSNRVQISRSIRSTSARSDGQVRIRRCLNRPVFTLRWRLLQPVTGAENCDVIMSCYVHTIALVRCCNGVGMNGCIWFDQGLKLRLKSAMYRIVADWRMDRCGFWSVLFLLTLQIWCLKDKNP